MENTSPSIGGRVRQAREAAGMSQTELARATGYANRCTIAKIELGITFPAWAKIPAMAAALEVTPEWILNGGNLTPAPEPPWFAQTDRGRAPENPNREPVPRFSLDPQPREPEQSRIYVDDETADTIRRLAEEHQLPEAEVVARMTAFCLEHMEPAQRPRVNAWSAWGERTACVHFPTIAAERAKRGMSLDALAQELGVTRKTVYNWEQAGRIPQSALEQMADLFQVSTDYLLERPAATQ